MQALYREHTAELEAHCKIHKHSSSHAVNSTQSRCLKMLLQTIVMFILWVVVDVQIEVFGLHRCADQLQQAVQ